MIEARKICPRGRAGGGAGVLHFEFIDIPKAVLYDTANGTAISSTYTPFQANLLQLFACARIFIHKKQRPKI